MGLDVFLQELIAKGRVILASSDAVEPGDAGDVQAVLLELDRRARRDAPGDAPALSLPAATWAARLLHRGCQCFAYRDLAADVVARDLAEPCPTPSNVEIPGGRRPEGVPTRKSYPRPKLEVEAANEPTTIWSVDLTLRWLPDLFSLARGVADGDPLLESLRGLARLWPLSSVGVADLKGIDPDAVLADDCLRRLYVDRILAYGDTSRLEHVDAAEAVREALGLRTELCTVVAHALEATS